MRRIGAFALALVLFPALATAAAAQCGVPAVLHDGWTVAAPAAEGLDPKLICAIGPTLEKMTDADPNGIVIVRHGALVYEHYFGVDPFAWSARTVHALHSVTKSVTAILVGIAFDHGYLENLDAPVLSFFPNYADLRTLGKESITLRDLLSMTSGLLWPEHAISYNDPSNIWRRMTDASDPDRLVLAQPLAATPGTIGNYDSGGVELLGAVLQKVSERPLDQFAKKTLFDPLGITDWAWERMKNGDPSASAGLWLRPRDLAKIGQRMLNHGIWRGRRIVSAAWIREMTEAHSPTGWLSDLADSYGYLWWLGHEGIDTRNIAWIGGLGYGGQCLFVVPSLDLVVVATAGVHNRRNGPWVTGYTALGMAVRAALAH